MLFQIKSKGEDRMFNPKFEEVPFCEQSKVKAGFDPHPVPEDCSCSCSCYGTAGKNDDKSSSNSDTEKEI